MLLYIYEDFVYYQSMHVNSFFCVIHWKGRGPYALNLFYASFSKLNMTKAVR